MKALREFTTRLNIAGELLGFLWHRKLWWLIPIVVMLLLLSIILILGGTIIAPFIYTLF